MTSSCEHFIKIDDIHGTICSINTAILMFTLWMEYLRRTARDLRPALSWLNTVLSIYDAKVLFRYNSEVCVMKVIWNVWCAQIFLLKTFSMSCVNTQWTPRLGVQDVLVWIKFSERRCAVFEWMATEMTSWKRVQCVMIITNLHWLPNDVVVTFNL